MDTICPSIMPSIVIDVDWQVNTQNMERLYINKSVKGINATLQDCTQSNMSFK
jgi:hypothetical protein